MQQTANASGDRLVLEDRFPRAVRIFGGSAMVCALVALPGVFLPAVDGEWFSTGALAVFVLLGLTVGPILSLYRATVVFDLNTLKVERWFPIKLNRFRTEGRLEWLSHVDLRPCPTTMPWHQGNGTEVFLSGKGDPFVVHRFYGRNDVRALHDARQTAAAVRTFLEEAQEVVRRTEIRMSSRPPPPDVSHAVPAPSVPKRPSMPSIPSAAALAALQNATASSSGSPDSTGRPRVAPGSLKIPTRATGAPERKSPAGSTTPQGSVTASRDGPATPKGSGNDSGARR